MTQHKVNAHLGRDKYKTALQTSQHAWFADEPIENGGHNLGPCPTDFLISALAACTSITLRMYAEHKNIPLDGVDVEVQLERDREAGVTRMEKSILLHGDLSAEQRDKLMQVADRCNIHQVLTHPIEITSKLC